MAKGWHASGTAAGKLSQVHQDANKIGIEPTMTETRVKTPQYFEQAWVRAMAWMQQNAAALPPAT